jgi:hypothetical protein
MWCTNIAVYPFHDVCLRDPWDAQSILREHLAEKVDGRKMDRTWSAYFCHQSFCLWFVPLPGHGFPWQPSSSKITK